MLPAKEDDKGWKRDVGEEVVENACTRGVLQVNVRCCRCAVFRIHATEERTMAEKAEQ